MPQPFRLEGLEQLQAKLKALPKHLKDEIDAELQASAMTIEAAAKRDAPVDKGFLRNGISHYKAGDMTYEVVSNARYSAYVEFGTGAGVLVPVGYEEFAMQFKGKSGVITKGMNAQPFLIKNYRIEKPKLIARIKKIITDVK